jgi:uncharacterized membrane protein
VKKIFANSALILALVGSVITVLGAFGVEITQDQNTAIIGVVSAVLALGGAFFSPSVKGFGVSE